MENEAQNDKDSEESTVSEAALGLIMLQDLVGDALLEKYDNSSILPVDSMHQVDYSANPPAELSDNDNNTSHNSNDTIVLQQEIEDTIGKPNDDLNANTSSLNKPQEDNSLPVEMTENTTVDTSNLTKGILNLTVSPASASPQTPVSPNRGTVVFKSYRLHHRTTNNNSKTSSSPTNVNSARQPNSESDIQLANRPSGNSMRPPLPQTNTK